MVPWRRMAWPRFSARGGGSKQEIHGCCLSPVCELLLARSRASSINTRVQLTTDGHKVYVNAVEDAFGADVDYAGNRGAAGRGRQKSRLGGGRLWALDSVGIAAWIAHVTFWVLMAYGWFWDDLGPMGLGVLIFLWLAGRFGLPFIPYGEAMFASVRVRPRHRPGVYDFRRRREVLKLDHYLVRRARTAGVRRGVMRVAAVEPGYRCRTSLRTRKYNATIETSAPLTASTCGALVRLAA